MRTVKESFYDLELTVSVDAADSVEALNRMATIAETCKAAIEATGMARLRNFTAASWTSSMPSRPTGNETPSEAS